MIELAWISSLGLNAFLFALIVEHWQHGLRLRRRLAALREKGPAADARREVAARLREHAAKDASSGLISSSQSYLRAALSVEEGWES